VARRTRGRAARYPRLRPPCGWGAFGPSRFGTGPRFSINTSLFVAPFSPTASREGRLPHSCMKGYALIFGINRNRAGRSIPQRRCVTGAGLQLKVGYVIERAWTNIAEEERIGGGGRRTNLKTVGRCPAIEHQLCDARRFDCPAPINSDRSDHGNWNWDRLGRRVCQGGYRYCKCDTETQICADSDLSWHPEPPFAERVHLGTGVRKRLQAKSRLRLVSIVRRVNRASATSLPFNATASRPQPLEFLCKRCRGTAIWMQRARIFPDAREPLRCGMA